MRQSTTLIQGHPGEHAGVAVRGTASAWARVALLPAALVLIGLLAVINLSGYPAAWFDEGSYLQVARNLAHGAPYAQLSADGTQDYAPAIGVGPTLLVPVAVVLRLTDDSLAAARLVTVAFLLVASGLLYLAARYLFGRTTALLTLALLVALPALDWIPTGRQVLGEVPALAFLLAGGIIATRNSCYKGATLAGLLFGLTLVTKGQYLLILPPAIALFALADYFDRRQRRLTWFAVVLSVALATWALWIAALLLLVGGGQIAENVRLLRESSSGALIVLNPQRWLAGVRLLLGPSTFGLVVPSVIAGIVMMLRADGKRRFGMQALLIFQGLWFTWFAFGSIAWPRYAFPALALNTIFMATLIVATVRALPRAVERIGVRSQRSAATARFGAIAGVALVLLASTAAQVRPVFQTPDHTARDFAASLDRTLPAGAVVAGWEPEIGFFSDAPIQYPPLGSLDRVVRARWLNGAPAGAIGDIGNAEFLMVGPFGRWVGIYAPALTTGDYALVEQIGEYELWQRLDVSK